MNAFWWIAGDCLGFRRASAVAASTGKEYQFASELRYSPDHILPYDAQVERLAQHGFALWDVVASCQRPGSLDQDITNEQANPIREFCHEHKSTLRRIVLSNGGTGSSMFVKHFREWLESGDLEALDGHEASQKAFGKAMARGETKRQGHLRRDGSHGNHHSGHRIVLISALSVSPAAARYPYQEKRDFWDQHVYTPGLEDYRNHQKAAAATVESDV